MPPRLLSCWTEFLNPITYINKLLTASNIANPATAAPAGISDASTNKSYAALSASSGVPQSTLWHRAHARRSRKAKAASQQYLTPQEEKALVDYLLRACKNGYPLPIKYVRPLAHVIARQRCQRSSIGQTLANGEDVRPPGKNWPQAFHKRHPEIKAIRSKALDSNRHDHHIYHKVEDWFKLIGEQLRNPDILPENVYNMDETGVLLSVLSTLKVLVSSDKPQPHRKAGVKRTLVTAIECISADGVFGPLKAAYREQVEKLYRGGANIVGKCHFTQLYAEARGKVMKKQIIEAAWSRRNDTNTNHISRASSSAAEIDQARDSSGGPGKIYLEKLANAAEKAFAASALLLDQNEQLHQQNNEKKRRQLARSTVVGDAKILSDEAILEAEKKREEKKAKVADQIPHRSNRQILSSPAT
ncbi:hypothetical protein T310_1555 [Rasamsonia emersonii CBS 393.64]|uniref:HTH CENPB-type domain-containing protein n=1 Tax=Rasamsonia emersonii (strain ATCC 16479 / CBS 393.64 / IMI 116815) TaxID=1408163 RepID=A0A0F4Z1Y9_RASE3|nr:hypothetical protein T310_1555 [Rasamsonia emersonii CBS 393.64]KKA24370.1 hypothetical protein T310_1555 [Rasamsonia emersonii CBS 393.64]